MQDVLNNLTDQTLAAPLAQLINNLVSPDGGTLAGLTNALNQLTNTETGALGPLTELVNGLINTENEGLEPLVSALQQIIGGLDDNGGLLGGLLGSGGLLGGLLGDAGLGGLLGGLLGGGLGGGGGGSGEGVVSTVQEALASITDQTAVAPLTDLINSLVDPDTGTAAGITGALEDLTATDGGLAALGELVVALTTADNAALAPLTDALAELLQGVSGNEGTPLGDIVSGLLGEDGALADLLADGGLGDLLGGLLPGGTGGDGDGLITTVQDALATITDQTALAPLTELVDTLLNPDSGVLGGLTSTLEDLTSSTGGLAALDDLVDALLTSDNAALAPVTAALNDILQGLTGSPNSPIGQVLEGVLGNDGPLASLLGDAGLGGLLGGLLGLSLIHI